MALRLPDSWIWDSWYVLDDGVTHAFYLRASRALGSPDLRHRHPTVGHATSTDLAHWTVLEDALAPSEPPAFDDATTWTGSVVRDDDGLWWMFYTGTSAADHGFVQRIGAATSTDLLRWTKLSAEPLVEADPRFYLQGEVDEAWRDPWVFRLPGESAWSMLITARSNVESPERGVVGLATSDDLRSWTPRRPLSDPGQGFDQQEVLQFEVVDGVPIVLFSCARAELSRGRRLAGETGGVYSLPVDARLEHLDFAGARLFPRSDLYAGRLVRSPDGGWALLAFVNVVADEFVGELSDPIPVTADPVLGLVAR